jgi:hypothetical protein
MTGGPMAARDEQVATIAEEFPGWEAWQSLAGRWHARIVGAITPVMVNGKSVSGLREQIRQKFR